MGCVDKCIEEVMAPPSYSAGLGWERAWTRKAVFRIQSCVSNFILTFTKGGLWSIRQRKFPRSCVRKWALFDFLINWWAKTRETFLSSCLIFFTLSSVWKNSPQLLLILYIGHGSLLLQWAVIFWRLHNRISIKNKTRKCKHYSYESIPLNNTICNESCLWLAVNSAFESLPNATLASMPSNFECTTQNAHRKHSQSRVFPLTIKSYRFLSYNFFFLF